MTNSSIKAIKIAKENAAAIELALRAKNGWNTAHTFNTFGEMDALAARAELELEGLGISKSYRAGAVYDAVSGGVVANKYKSTRVVTVAKLLRKAAGWFLVAVATDTVWPTGYRSRTGLTLTKMQDDKAKAVLRDKYHCAE